MLCSEKTSCSDCLTKIGVVSPRSQFAMHHLEHMLESLSSASIFCSGLLLLYIYICTRCVNLLDYASATGKIILSALL